MKVVVVKQATAAAVVVVVVGATVLLSPSSLSSGGTRITKGGGIWVDAFVPPTRVARSSSPAVFLRGRRHFLMSSLAATTTAAEPEWLQSVRSLLEEVASQPISTVSASSLSSSAASAPSVSMMDPSSVASTSDTVQAAVDTAATSSSPFGTYWDDQVTMGLLDKVLTNEEITTAVVKGEETVTSISHFVVVAWSSLSPPLQVAMVGLGLTTTMLYTFRRMSFPLPDFRSGYEPYKRGEYNPDVARAYYAQHPLLVLRRTLQLLRLSYRSIFQYILDRYVLRNEEEKRAERAEELLALVNLIGPTAIKVGQALSVRPDLIPREYAEALSTLQDSVPPFPSDQAQQILRSELGVTQASKLENLGFKDGPVASASIGQVYRGTAVSSSGTTQEVAVKIQRPDVLAEIALDLFLVSELAPVYQKLTGAATDFKSLVSEWGRGFVAELSYTAEAQNTARFNGEMSARGLNAVTAPRVVDEFCSERVLVTEWIDGERLDQSDADDVPRLCSVALNAYLVMLLETGTLHCDPHPGNLLRTRDGKLCILDFGMTLETDPDLQYNLLEFVAHLTSEAYDNVPQDLVKLGFLKANRLESVRKAGLLEPLTFMLKQAGQGGGAEKVRERVFDKFRKKYPNLTDEELRLQMRSDMRKKMEVARQRESAVSGITVEVEELQKRNRDAFSIPDWFLYTSRAFLTLEGICLRADEDYSIIKSCFPYVARRLLGDESPRAQQALRDLLYGPGGNVIDVKRLSDLADGFSTYTTTTKSINQQVVSGDAVNGGSSLDTTTAANGERRRRANTATTTADMEATITLAKDSADILLSPRGNLVQNLLLEESTRAASAQVKDVLREAPQRFREALPLNLGSLLPPLPLEKDLSPFLRKSESEEAAQALVEKVSQTLLAAASSQSSKNRGDEEKEEQEDGGAAAAANGNGGRFQGASAVADLDAEQVAIVAKALRENLPKYAPLLGQLGGKFASNILEHTSGSIDLTLEELAQHARHDSGGSETMAPEAEGENPMVRVAAKGLANVAMQGADTIKRQTAAASQQEAK